MSDPENEGKGFKVTDRRKFTSEGELRKEAEDSPEPSPQRTPSVRPSDAAARAPSARAVPRHATEAVSEATFLDLVGMLATNAMLQLGDMPNPASGERVENLQAVQDMIAFLEILQQKTKGNLTEEEGEVLEQVLYDLRMRYMAKAKILNL
jgi:hypothetical protein